MKFGFLGVGNMAAAIMKGMCLGKSFIGIYGIIIIN